MGLIDKIKNDVKKTGQSKGKFIYFREGQKIRVRFLIDMDDGIELTFHDSFEKGINIPCQDLFGRSCKYCEEDEGLRTRSQYAWSVYNYETKEVQIFMFPVNNCSPIPALMAMYENYGTITDRDYVISVSGKQTNKTYSVVPMDKVKFRNEKAKALSRSQILILLDKAYPCELNESKDELEEEGIRWGEDVAEKEQNKYQGKSPKELYFECKKREIEVEQKKPAIYYINLLLEDDKVSEDWGEDVAEDDEWDEE